MEVLREVEMGIKKRSGERFVLYLCVCFFFFNPILIHRECNRIFFYRSFRVFHVYYYGKSWEKMKLETRIKIKISIRSLHSFYKRNLFAQYFTVYKRDVKRKRNTKLLTFIP